MNASATSLSAVAPISIGGVALAVRDLDRIAGFYEETVGLQTIDRGADFARLGAGGVAFLHLQQRPGLRAVDPAQAGLFHTAFLLPTRADLGRWLHHADNRRLVLDGAADHLVSEAVYLHDPEGNGIEIYSDRPREGWRWDGGQVVMANERLDMIGLRALATGAWDGAPAGTRIGHVHLQVGDVAAAEQFYAGRLGFEVTRHFPQASFMSTGGYHHHVAANTWNSAGASRREPDRAGLAAVTLRLADDAVLDAIRARGPVSDLADPWGTQIRLTTDDQGDMF